MAKGSQELERNFIAEARDKTGHDLAEWMTIIEQADLPAKQNTILKWIKDNHALNHMQASLLAGIYLNDGQPVFDYAVLFQKLFDGKDDLLPLYRTLEQRIKDTLPDVLFIPTKAYISLEDQRVFGCITPMRAALRVGLDLGDAPFDDTLLPAKGLGAMPNIGHMIEIADEAAIPPDFTDYVAQAYARTHQK